MKRISLLLAVLLITSNVFGSVLIEPYIGHRLGSYDQGATTSNMPDATYSSLTEGIRLGAQFLGVQFGLDYSMSSPEYDFDQKDGAASYTKKADSKYLGAFVGYDFPIFLRVYGTYFFSHEVEFSDYTLKGDNSLLNSYSLGVSFSPIPIPIPKISLNINLEYRKLNYDTKELTGGSVSSIDNSAQEFMLGLSIPILF